MNLVDKYLIELSTPQQHQLKIAKSTLKMSDAGAMIMGGMSKEEARDFLKSIGYSDSKIRRLEASKLAKNITADDYPHATLTFRKDRVVFRISFSPGSDPSLGVEPFRNNVPAAIRRVFKVMKKHKVPDENIEVIG